MKRKRHHQLTIYIPVDAELSFDEIRERKEAAGLTWYDVLELGVITLE